MRENEMIIRQRHAKHRARKHHHDGALYFYSLFRIHDVEKTTKTPAPNLVSAGGSFNLAAKAGEAPFRAVGTRTLFTRTSLVHV